MWDSVDANEVDQVPVTDNNPVFIILYIFLVIILCVLFYAFSDPEVRLCVFGNAFVAAESEQVQRESRRNRSPMGASRTRAPEGRLHRRAPEAAAPARRREGAVSRFSAPPR